MAKANANKAPDPETRKLLWLKIARREVERCRSTDIEGTMRVLQVWREHENLCIRPGRVSDVFRQGSIRTARFLVAKHDAPLIAHGLALCLSRHMARTQSRLM